jgi:uncharacterized protein (TIGR03435 family)
MSETALRSEECRHGVRGSLARFAVIGTLITVGLACRPLRPQDAGSKPQTTEPAMMAKDADPDWEVVTVKPSDPNDTVSHININGRRVMVESEPVEAMLKFAYGVQHSQIVGAPERIRTERWDVSGVPDAAGKPNLPQFQSMMRKLLAERFGLTLHGEQREMSAYALTVTKGGPKLQRSAGDPNGGPGSDGRVSNGIETHRYTNASMPDLGLMLMIYGDRPIVDQTGLQGRYDFQLRWTKDEAPATATDAPPGLFTAMQEQLGLKLEPARVPADVLVLDAVERPSAN